MKSTGTQPDLPIIFEDDDLLIINKPVGVLSQGDRTGDRDVSALCKQYLKQKKSGYLGLLHRLDRPVSGLMMLAKNPRAAQKISEQIRDRLIQKTYYAVVFGRAPANALLTDYLVKDHDRNVVRAVDAHHEQAKKAELSFIRKSQQKYFSLLSVHLQTGRSHQIRVQLAAAGLPIWGDYKYGPSQPDGRAMALVAAELVFHHPTTGENISLVVKDPQKMPWNKFKL